MTETVLTPAASPATAHRPFSPTAFSISVATAVILNVAVFLIASAGGASMIIEQPSESTLNVGIVIAATLVPLALAGLVTWFLARRRPVLRTVLAWVGLAVALVSFASPLFVSADLATGLALGAMHVIAGLAWFVGVRKPRA
ncbi:DUF6069 family protein [Agromyces seonyuensis]|uniref:Uncharacterized protein n=1 Tax=Agromyces seonyuensis TaxID=2662446 RepID=A0A6I4P1M1_9MICO|nr:DUF6069 family protein [Agromyces seonyuensis]MWB99432.1 hypothetical protein [Agromyces seonyuensis]